MGEVYDGSNYDYYGEEYGEYNDQAVEVYDQSTEEYYPTEEIYDEVVEDYTYDNADKIGYQGAEELEDESYYHQEEIEESSFLKKLTHGKSAPSLPDGWVEMYDESMEAYYYLHEESGEASWVRPEEQEYDEEGAAVTAPKRFGSQVKEAYEYNEMTRTWNPNAMSTTGSAFATLRPRITPVVNRSLHQGVEENIMGTQNIHELSEAEQEMKRLRVFDRHLRIKGKSKVQVSDTTAVNKGNKKSNSPSLPKISPAASRTPFNPDKRAEIRSIVHEDLTRAKRELQVKVNQNGSPSSRSNSSQQIAVGMIDGEVWSSTKWPVGVDGCAHPPAQASKADFDIYGERALAEAWRRRRAPAPTESNRFALGVPEVVVEDTGPPMPLHKKFGDDMDHYALLTMHYMCNGYYWTQRTGWDDQLHGKRPPGSHLAWFGIHTQSTLVQRVVNIVMPHNNIEGPLIPEMRWLDKLKTLSMPQNKLSGPIPAEWSTMTSLTTIDLSHNHISGSLPSKLFEGLKRHRDVRERTPVSVKTLNLSHNYLHGEIPNSISTLMTLTQLNLSNNTLSQPLPEGIMKCYNLRALRLNDNKLSGKLPAGIANLSQLMILDLSSNGIEGEIPTLPKQLSKVHLQNNKLTRDIPLSFFQLVNIADVNLSNNYLSGAVSDDVVNLKRLRILRLDGNRYSLADRSVITDCLSAYLPALVRQQGFKI